MLYLKSLFYANIILYLLFIWNLWNRIILLLLSFILEKENITISLLINDIIFYSHQIYKSDFFASYVYYYLYKKKISLKNVFY